MTTGAPNEKPSIVKPPAVASRRPGRRWWVYLGAGLGAIVVVALGLVAGIAIYWRSLINNYTSAQPESLPVVHGSDSDFASLSSRWTAFREAVTDDTATEPFRASAAELNLLIAQNPGLKDRVWMIISNSQIYGQFTFPLDPAQQRELPGRYVNGLARLNLDFQDGWLTVRVAELKANGKPIPRWILRRIQKENLVKDLDQNLELTAFLNALHTIEVQGDQIVLQPQQRAPR